MGATDINISFGANTAGIQQALSDIRQSVNQYSKNITSNFQTVNQTLNETRNKFATINNAIDQARNKWTDWADKTATIRNSFRIAQVTAQQLSAPLREFSRFEDAATRLAPLVGGLEAAKILCAQLRDEAANGTMSFEQLASVAGRLSTVFKNPADVQKWTTIFHNISAGTGLGNHGIRGIHRKFFEINPSPRSHGNEILFQTREVPDCGGNLLKFDASYTSHVPARFSGIQ